MCTIIIQKYIDSLHFCIFCKIFFSSMFCIVTTDILLYKGKLQCLLTFQTSSYCCLAVHVSIYRPIHIFHSFLLAFKRKKHRKYSEYNIIFVNIKRHVALSLKVIRFVDCYFLKVDVHCQSEHLVRHILS